MTISHRGETFCPTYFNGDGKTATHNHLVKSMLLYSSLRYYALLAVARERRVFACKRGQGRARELLGPVSGEASLLLPALDRALIPAEEGSDLLP